jgi:hypothetical protein
MKKFIVLTSLLLIGSLLLTGCGENKKTSSLFGMTSTPAATASLMDTQLATTAGALYDVTKVGAGVGTTTFGVRGRSYVGSTVTGLGEANDAGEYTVTNTGTTGLICTVKFLNSGQVVYFNMENPFGTTLDTLQLYSAQDLSASKITIADVPRDATALALLPRYIPSMFCKLSDNEPLSWFSITSVAGLDQAAMEASINTFITNNFPDSMVNTVNGTMVAGTLSLTLTSTMTDKPTDANPADLAGSGTMTLATGEILAITVDVQVGATGPVGGTQTFTSTSGLSGTLTFNADKTMTGTISQNDVVIATISIAANGTGTLTDVATGAVSTIS